MGRSILAKYRHIVKRHGRNEVYDPKKVYASIFAACISVQEPAGAAEVLAQHVTDHVSDWIQKKTEVTSNDIRVQAAKHLNALNPDAGFQYLHHRVVW